MPYKDPHDSRLLESRRKHYYNNKQQYRDRNNKHIEEVRKFLREQKEVPCTDCGIQYPYYVMDFDHIDEGKSFNVSRMSRETWKNIRAEVDKCEVVCSNCHRARTYNRMKT